MVTLHLLFASSQREKSSLGAEPRFELWPAFQQADALPTELRRSLTELRRTLYWATPHPDRATSHPNWATPQPNWATQHPLQSNAA
jgi:hypothetical protein